MRILKCFIGSVYTRLVALSLIPALIVICARAGGTTVFHIAAYGVLPALSCHIAYRAASKGAEKFIAFWIPGALAAAMYAAVWGGMLLPGSVMLSLLLGIPGAVAGEAKRRKK